MDTTDSTTRLAAAVVLAALLAAFVLVQPTSMVKWLQKKNYQYEATTGLSMLTPTEKFVFNSVLFLTLAMLAIACTLYLPDHVLTVSQRTYYYFAGDAALIAKSLSAAENLYGTASRAGDVVLDAAREWAYQVGKTVTASSAQAMPSQSANIVPPL